PRFVLVSSACPGDGKTTTAINLAASLTLKADTSVLLLDADMRKPAIADLLGIPRSPGLADVLSGRARLEEAVVRTEQFPNFFILPAGEPTRHAAELLDSDRWRSLAAEIRGRFSSTIVDAPPVAAVADYDLLQKTCDGVLLVVRPDHTERTLCIKTLQSIPKDKFLGVLLNQVREWLFWKAPGYYHYYGKHQSPGSG
ncbi:MAG: CpsD/CapB family tyrosine-protein kinase, partial [Terriglobia bacterium]